MILLSKAKCFKCGATATAETFEQAEKKINHAVGLSQGIKCGTNYGKVREITRDGVVVKVVSEKPKKAKKPKKEKEIPETTQDTQEESAIPF